MRKLIYCFIFLCVSGIGISQEDPKTENLQFRLNALNPGAELEVGLSETTTGLFNAGVAPIVILDIFSDNFGDFPLVPFFDIQLRHFYNFKRRQDLGKSVQKNNGNYIALKFVYYHFGILKNYNNSENRFITGPVYGIQRTYFDWLHLSFESGFGIRKERTGSYVMPILSFTMGYNF